MKILIYGTGAVGLGLASFLQAAGAGVHLLGRRQQVAEAIRKNGIQRTGVMGDHDTPAGAIEVFTVITEIPATDYDVIAVCVKSFDSVIVAQMLAKFSCKAPVVLFQNGWGNAEIFAQHLPEKRIHNARVISGYVRCSDHEIDISVHADAIHIGSLFGTKMPPVITNLCARLTQGGMPAEITDDIAGDLWAKMLYNCALNPLGAILRVPYGALGESENTRAIIRDIVQEVYAVMESHDLKTSWKTPEDYLEVLFGTLVPVTAEHESSMLQDLRAGRQTEIEALNGQIVRLGAEGNIPTSVNTTLCRIIREQTLT